jgi:tRNA(fMet)-specific endonuclease VapC
MGEPRGQSGAEPASRRYVLDTDAAVDVLRRKYGVAERLATVSPDDVGVTTMTVAELLYGVAASADPARNRAEVERFLGEVQLLPFGRRAAAAHAEARWQLRAQPIGPSDLVIAATALAAGATLVTANSREYGRVPGLRVENWRVADGRR